MCEGTLPHTPPPILRAAQFRATLAGDVSHGIAPSALAADHKTATRKPVNVLKTAHGLESNFAATGRGPGMLAQAEEDVAATAVGEQLSS